MHQYVPLEDMGKWMEVPSMQFHFTFTGSEMFAASSHRQSVASLLKVVFFRPPSLRLDLEDMRLCKMKYFNAISLTMQT